MTNRILSSRANKVLQAFPDAFLPAVHATHVGNPVREDMLGIIEPAERLRLNDQPLRLLVLGGSLGAYSLNAIVPQALALMNEDQRPVVRHQAGRAHHKTAIANYKEQQVDAQIDAFVDDMAGAYTWADLVICRSGAMTIAELAVIGVPAILVPYPYAVDDHQTANAMYLAAEKGAILIQQNELEAEQLASWLRDFDDNRDKLLTMANIARNLGLPNSTKMVAETVLNQGVSQ